MRPARDLAAAAVVGSGARGVSGPIVVSGFSRTSLWTTAVCVLLVAAEPAWRSVMFDRLLATTDNRIITGRALLDLVSPTLEATLRERYALTRRFETGAGDGSGRLYDQLDAFYLPLTGLRGMTRPGPAFELYRRKAVGAGQ